MVLNGFCGVLLVVALSTFIATLLRPSWERLS